MTQKDYMKFAEQFKRLLKVEHSIAYQAGVENCLQAAMDIFAKDNPKFSSVKFLKAVRGTP